MRLKFPSCFLFKARLEPPDGSETYCTELPRFWPSSATQTGTGLFFLRGGRENDLPLVSPWARKDTQGKGKAEESFGGME